MTTSVLFLCPHSAAKSVASATFLRDRAARRGLDVEVSNAGTDPDDIVLPIVRERLEGDGLEVRSVPHVVTAEELAGADIIVNIGCAHDDLPTTKSLVEWEIPNFSDDPAVAFATIEAHVDAMVDALAHR
jgi:protein-tyrosine-phosphatase